MVQHQRVELRRVGVRYGRRSDWVLREVSLSLHPGRLVEVTGANGAGKSSLLRTVAGVLAPAAGVVAGRPSVVGWAPERFPQAQPFCVEQYLLSSARVHGLARAVEAVAREVDRFGLRPLLNTRLPHLSKGSAQKVGIAQALLADPGLLVLDEPWSGLDDHARQAVPGAVREVLDRGGSVLVADHQQQVAALSPDAVWHVHDGTVHELAPAAGRQVVVEAEVDAADAEDVLALLRERGLSPRVR